MEDDTQAIIDAIDTDSSRRILAAASREPMSAEELERELESSLATVYRRTEELVDVEFLTESVEIDPDGNNYTSFETAIRRISFTIEGGEFRVDVQVRDDVVDRFGRLWRSLSGRPS